MLPDYVSSTGVGEALDVITYSRSMSHFRQKGTSGLFSFIKPYRNIELITPYDASNFKFDPGAAFRGFTHFTHFTDNLNESRRAEFSSDASEIHSNQSTNFGGGYVKDKFTDSFLEEFTENNVTNYEGDYEAKLPGDRHGGTLNKFRRNGGLKSTDTTKFSLKSDLKNSILHDNESDYFENNQSENYITKNDSFKLKNNIGSVKNDFQLKNEFRRFRRKDSQLRYTRNLFLSNHLVDDIGHLDTYTGNWLNISEFEPDRQRSRARNLKHGSKYRLNFNTELWWTRVERPDYHIRRVDGVEFDEDFGMLDSEGEIGHLHKGLRDVIFTPDNVDIFDTTLPLFEKSLIDPESPALNEDGEFPEFDLNLIYSTYDINTVKTYKLKKNLRRYGLGGRIRSFFEEKKRPNKLFKKNQFKKRYFNSGGLKFGDSLVKISNEFSLENLNNKNGLINPPELTDLYKKNIYNRNGKKKWDYLYNKVYNLKFKLGNVDTAAQTNFETSGIIGEMLSLEESLYFRKKNYKFSSPIFNFSEYVSRYDLSAFDIGDIIDAISHKDTHPISFASEQIYGSLIDQKVDEAVENYLLSGVDYSNVFSDYRSITSRINNEKLTIDWYSIDFIGEMLEDHYENIQGINYDLVLLKYADNYWRSVLEIDSAWSDSFSASYPQIHDNVENMSEYLPIWNYDPSIWEVYGFDYEITPLVVTEDSKLILSSKILKFDSAYKWLSQKDLTTGGVSVANLGWGGSDIVSGFNDWLPYDLMYASDDDTDVDTLADIMFFSENEDELSKRESSTFVSRTSNTSSSEFPAMGIKAENFTAEMSGRSRSSDLIIATRRKLTTAKQTTEKYIDPVRGEKQIGMESARTRFDEFTEPKETTKDSSENIAKNFYDTASSVASELNFNYSVDPQHALDENSSNPDDSFDIKKVHSLRYKARRTSVNDLRLPFGAVDLIPREELGLLPDETITKSGFVKPIEVIASEFSEMETNLSAQIPGVRSNPQYDIGGESGYKSGIFAPRFWYDIYSILNTTPVEDWSQGGDRKFELYEKAPNTVLEVQEDIMHDKPSAYLKLFLKENAAKSLNKSLGVKNLYNFVSKYKLGKKEGKTWIRSAKDTIVGDFSQSGINTAARLYTNGKFTPKFFYKEITWPQERWGLILNKKKYLNNLKNINDVGVLKSDYTNIDTFVNFDMLRYKANLEKWGWRSQPNTALADYRLPFSVLHSRGINSSGQGSIKNLKYYYVLNNKKIIKKVQIEAEHKVNTSVSGFANLAMKINQIATKKILRIDIKQENESIISSKSQLVVKGNNNYISIGKVFIKNLKNKNKVTYWFKYDIFKLVHEYNNNSIEKLNVRHTWKIRDMGEVIVIGKYKNRRIAHSNLTEINKKQYNSTKYLKVVRILKVRGAVSAINGNNKNINKIIKQPKSHNKLVNSIFSIWSRNNIKTKNKKNITELVLYSDISQIGGITKDLYRTEYYLKNLGYMVIKKLTKLNSKLNGANYKNSVYASGRLEIGELCRNSNLEQNPSILNEKIVKVRVIAQTCGIVAKVETPNILSYYKKNISFRFLKIKNKIFWDSNTFGINTKKNIDQILNYVGLNQVSIWTGCYRVSTVGYTGKLAALNIKNSKTVVDGFILDPTNIIQTIKQRTRLEYLEFLGEIKWIDYVGFRAFSSVSSINDNTLGLKFWLENFIGYSVRGFDCRVKINNTWNLFISKEYIENYDNFPVIGKLPYRVSRVNKNSILVISKNIETTDVSADVVSVVDYSDTETDYSEWLSDIEEEQVSPLSVWGLMGKPKPKQLPDLYIRPISIKDTLGNSSVWGKVAVVAPINFSKAGIKRLSWLKAKRVYRVKQKLNKMGLYGLRALALNKKKEFLLHGECKNVLFLKKNRIKEENTLNKNNNKKIIKTRIILLNTKKETLFCRIWNKKTINGDKAIWTLKVKNNNLFQNKIIEKYDFGNNLINKLKVIMGILIWENNNINKYWKSGKEFEKSTKYMSGCDINLIGTNRHATGWLSNEMVDSEMEHSWKTKFFGVALTNKTIRGGITKISKQSTKAWERPFMEIVQYYEQMLSYFKRIVKQKSIIPKNQLTGMLIPNSVSMWESKYEYGWEYYMHLDEISKNINVMSDGNSRYIMHLLIFLLYGNKNKYFLNLSGIERTRPWVLKMFKSRGIFQQGPDMETIAQILKFSIVTKIKYKKIIKLNFIGEVKKQFKPISVSVWNNKQIKGKINKNLDKQPSINRKKSKAVRRVIINRFVKKVKNSSKVGTVFWLNFTAKNIDLVRRLRVGGVVSVKNSINKKIVPALRRTLYGSGVWRGDTILFGAGWGKFGIKNSNQKIKQKLNKLHMLKINKIYNTNIKSNLRLIANAEKRGPKLEYSRISNKKLVNADTVVKKNKKNKISKYGSGIYRNKQQRKKNRYKLAQNIAKFIIERKKHTNKWHLKFNHIKMFDGWLWRKDSKRRLILTWLLFARLKYSYLRYKNYMKPTKLMGGIYKLDQPEMYKNTENEIIRGDAFTVRTKKLKYLRDKMRYIRNIAFIQLREYKKYPKLRYWRKLFLWYINSLDKQTFPTILMETPRIELKYSLELKEVYDLVNIIQKQQQAYMNDWNFSKGRKKKFPEIMEKRRKNLNLHWIEDTEGKLRNTNKELPWFISRLWNIKAKNNRFGESGFSNNTSLIKEISKSYKNSDIGISEINQKYINIKDLILESGNKKYSLQSKNIVSLYYKRKYLRFSDMFRGGPSKLFTNAWSQNLKKKLSKINPYSFDNQKAEFQLGMKVGDIDDSSYWSSGTEFVNEQYLFDSTIFNQDYVLYGYSELDEEHLNLQKNKQRLAWRARRNMEFYSEPSIISGHSGADSFSEEQSSDDENQMKYDSDTYSWTRTARHLDAAITAGMADVDVTYNNPGNRPADELNMFSYVDWGQDSYEEDNIGSRERAGPGVQYTADLLREPTTESVYMDFIENEYAREARQFPEEILDWTMSDRYTEMFINHEISDIPNSINESEQYSVNSSQSISDFVRIPRNSINDLSDSTTILSEEPSSENTSLSDQRSANDGRGLHQEIEELMRVERNVAPNAHPEVDFFNFPTSWSQKPTSNFMDNSNESLFEAEKMNESYLADWGDSSKMELEDNSREPETFSRQQKYLDAYFFESVLDELITLVNINRDLGIRTYIFDYIVKQKKLFSFRATLYKKTNYLSIYRGLMLDIGLADYMY